MSRAISPCCQRPVVKKPRYGGAVMNPYCSKCQRRIWSGKILTREKQKEAHAIQMQKLLKKEEKKQEVTGNANERFIDALAYVLDKRIRDF